MSGAKCGADGGKIVTPLDWNPRLKRACGEERANYETMPLGIYWPAIDEELGIVSTLKGHRAGSVGRRWIAIASVSQFA